MHVRTFTLLLAATLLASPVALGWSGMGSSEPDTKHDAKDGWMFKTPDTSAGTNKVYFNGFTSANVGGQLGTMGGGFAGNANVGLIRTEFSPVSYSEFAILGVWKDCNKDGYIGLQKQGLWEYRSELLFDTSVCPKQDIPDPIPADWIPVHNDGQWVHEFISIGWVPQTANGDINKFDINDNGARVWYDSGTPEPGAAANPCWLNPPVGSLHSTGGLLFWTDCNTGYAITDTIDTIAAMNPLLAQFSFADAPRHQYASHSTLNQKNPWGTQDQASDVQAWDCSQPQQEVIVPQEAGGGQQNVSMPRVPPTTRTDGSPAGTMNATGSGFDQCRRRTDTIGGGTGGTLANAPYALEASVTQAPSKTSATYSLYGIAESHRPAPCALDATDSGLIWEMTSITGSFCSVVSLNTPVGPVSVGTDIGTPTGAGTPPGLGQKFTTMDGVWWNAVSITSVGGTMWTTYYAFVSPTAVSKYSLTLPKGSAVGAYGQEACGAYSTGEHNGWDCDANHWYKDANGVDISERMPYLGHEPGNTGPCTPSDTGLGNIATTGPDTRGCVRISPAIGSPYSLRDVDCTDNSLDPVRTAVGRVNDPTGQVGPLNGCDVMTT